MLVVDEPTLGLAPLVVESLKTLFADLRNEGTALLLVEEKLRVVEEMAQHLAFIRLGRITWTGAASALDRDDVNAYYLGTHGAEPAVAEPEHPVAPTTP